jgi:hypothetical protein
MPYFRNLGISSIRLYFAPIIGAIKEVRAELARIERSGK